MNVKVKVKVNVILNVNANVNVNVNVNVSVWVGEGRWGGKVRGDGWVGEVGLFFRCPAAAFRF